MNIKIIQKLSLLKIMYKFVKIKGSQKVNTKLLWNNGKGKLEHTKQYTLTEEDIQYILKEIKQLLKYID